MSSGPEHILNEIKQGVEKHGSYEVDWLILVNAVFPHSSVNSATKLREWAKENNLRYESIEVEGRGKKTKTIIKFSRR
jgi:hypothetical protein